MRHTFMYILTICLTFGFLIPCQAKPQPRAQHLIIIGLDGMSSSAYRKADMPYLKAQAEKGAYALRKRSCLPSSSAINWASIFCGSNPELHGFLNWGTQVAELEQRQVSPSGSYPSVFRLIRDQYPTAKIGYFYDWNGMKYVCDTTALSVYRSSGSYNVEAMTSLAEQYIIDECPDVAVFVYDQPDHTGHDSGWESPKYMSNLHMLDSCVQTIVHATQKAGFYDDCIFVVLADHGGTNKGHGKASLEELESPFIIWGKNILPYGCLDEEYSMMNFDVGAILADIYGVTPPQVWTGRSCFPIFK